VDAVMFRFPARKKDGADDISDTLLAAHIATSLNANGWCVFFAYGSIENKLRPFQFAEVLRMAGLTLVDVCAISKPWWGGKKADTHLTGSYEYVFLFTNAKRWYLDRSYVHDFVVGEKYDGVSCPGNSWELKHYNPAELYPQDVAAAILKMVCLLPGSVVLDPLMGGSSGVEAAIACGHSFIGYEPNIQKYNSYARVLKRLSKVIADRDRDQRIGLELGGCDDSSERHT
jgi:hypothetical protein